jgi:CHAT domain-containing protein
VHFAGHGQVDPTRPGDAAIYLDKGKPLSPVFFRKTRLGTQQAPFIFFNACMVGTGGEMLGDFGGFPGNCLAGGFTGLLAPLWAVNDSVARAIAMTFYNATLRSPSRPVADVLRDIRAKYAENSSVSSYLAYVYYGSPHLRVERVSS